MFFNTSSRFEILIPIFALIKIEFLNSLDRAVIISISSIKSILLNTKIVGLSIIFKLTNVSFTALICSLKDLCEISIT